MNQDTIVLSTRGKSGAKSDSKYFLLSEFCPRVAIRSKRWLWPPPLHYKSPAELQEFHPLLFDLASRAGEGLDAFVPIPIRLGSKTLSAQVSGGWIGKQCSMSDLMLQCRILDEHETILKSLVVTGRVPLTNDRVSIEVPDAILLAQNGEFYAGASLIEIIAHAPLLDLSFQASFADLLFPVSVLEIADRCADAMDESPTSTRRRPEDFLPATNRIKAIADLLATMALQTKKDSKNEDS